MGKMIAHRTAEQRPRAGGMKLSFTLGSAFVKLGGDVIQRRKVGSAAF